MHLKRVTLFPEQYPTREYYPFNLAVLTQTPCLYLDAPVTMFVGENGTGKSTLLEALAHRCDIHIWRYEETARGPANPYRNKLQDYIAVEWANGRVPGSFFCSAIFRHFAEILDEWAATDPGQLDYFGGRSLTTLSHGQSLMSFFRARYKIKGLYLLDEPETALSPKSQIELLNLVSETSRAGHAQFIIATHSPILLACPGATLYSFDSVPVQRVSYEQTDHYRIYASFMRDRADYLKARQDQ